MHDRAAETSDGLRRPTRWRPADAQAPAAALLPACPAPTARQPVNVPAAALRQTIRTVASQAGNRATQRAVLALQRETAQDVITRYSDWGGLSVRAGALGQYLGQRARAGDYGIVTQVVHASELHSYDKDDVAVATMKQFSVSDVIMMARNQAAVQMLRLLKNEMTDWWSWRITDEERRLGDLIAAVLDDPGARVIWNRARILEIKNSVATDLEALTQLYSDDSVVDDGTLAGRTSAVLGVTASLVVPGLQTGVEFSDTGFAGDQNPGGAGFRDPHPSSRNQVGHFLTAVGLQFSPDLVSRPIPGIGLVRATLGVPTGNTVREMIQAPAALSDEDVALRLTIGHEKAPDPPGGMATAVSILFAGIGERLGPAPEDETEDQRERRVAEAMMDETRRQVIAIIQAFRAQFAACSDADVTAWNKAITASGLGDTLDLGAAEPELQRISIVYAQRGNSIQDLRLSLVGWRLGQLLRSNAFGNDRKRVAAWLRTNLG